MKRLTIVILLSGAVALAGCETTAEDARIVGQLESDRIVIRSEVFEPLVEIPVVEGERIRAGDLLFRQDTTRIIARLREAEAATAQSRARLDELLRGPRREQIEATRASAEGARREAEFRRAAYQRAQRVYEQNLSSADALDQAKAALDRAETELAFQQARLSEMLSGTTVEELRQAEQAVSQAEARLSTLRVDLARHEPLAPVDGIVDSRLFEPGEQPAIGQPVLVLLAGPQPYARVYVPESLRVRVRPGVRAKVRVDGLREVLDGTVRWVSSEAAFTPYFALTEHDRGRLSFVAKVDLETGRQRLPDGIPVEVELSIDAGGDGS